MSPDVDEIAGRPEAPILLVTKLHPPFVPAQTIARERLFARLREGQGRRLSLVDIPIWLFGRLTLRPIVLAYYRRKDAKDTQEVA